jgi:hypothetical protein
MIKVSNRFYILSFVLLIASTAKNSVSAREGYLDVGMVVLIAFTGIVIHGRNKSTPRYDESMWIYHDSLDFNILLPGAAWQTYFFLSILPYAINLWKSGSLP